MDTRADPLVCRVVDAALIASRGVRPGSSRARRAQRAVTLGSMASSIRPTDSALAALDDAPVWLNSPPLDAEALRGHVVLVDFWTYSCVNYQLVRRRGAVSRRTLEITFVDAGVCAYVFTFG